MTEIADDRSWWADVEHLRPGAVTTVAPPSATLDPRSAAAPVVDIGGHREDAAAAPRSRRFERDGGARDDDGATLRRGRITGRTAPRDHDAAEPVLRRADAASFADAMDIDGAFGAAVRGAESREIVLTGHPVEEEWVEEQLWDEPGARRRHGGGPVRPEPSRPAADLWDDEGDLWEEPARRQPDPSQAVLWDDDDLWVQPARRRGPDSGPDRDTPRGRRAAAPSGGTRRTVVISSNAAAPAPEASRRPLREIAPDPASPAAREQRPHPIDRINYDPDRVAMWAVVLGILLVLIAASSSLT